MKALRQYDAGVVLKIPLRDQDDEIIDLDGTETAWFLLEAPSGHRKRFAATVDETTETIEYTTETLTFDEWGTWRLQAEVIGTGYHVRTAVLLLEVQSNLDAPRLVLRPDPAMLVLRAVFPSLDYVESELVFGVEMADGSFGVVELDDGKLPVLLYDGTTALVEVFQ